MSPESIHPAEDFEESLDKQHLRESIFVSVINEKLLEEFEDALYESEFEEEEVEEFKKNLESYSFEDIKQILSLPYEIRVRRLAVLKKNISEGKMTIAGAIERLKSDAAKEGYTLGYHVSDAEVIPRKDAKTGSEAWIIDGKEEDHRDDDLPMAYYSTDLEHMYRKKRARYMYLVRAHTGENSPHRQDNDGAWGRASKLDVIARLDLEGVMGEVNRREKDYQKDSDEQAV